LREKRKVVEESEEDEKQEEDLESSLERAVAFKVKQTRGRGRPPKNKPIVDEEEDERMEDQQQ
jgi:hypothetical protein